MREKNVILSILRYRRPDIDWDGFDVSFQFAEPFAEDKRTERDEVSSLYGAGLMSLSTAVDRLDLVDDVEGEVDKINMGLSGMMYTPQNRTLKCCLAEGHV